MSPMLARTHFTAASPLTLPVDDRDPREWRRGREHYCVWLLDADTTAVQARLAAARAHLGGWLAPARRTPHITLFVCGFETTRARWDDDFDAAARQHQLAALRDTPVRDFVLEVGALDSFDSAVFLRVHDRSDALTTLRTALAREHREIRFAPYVPHVTVGLYRSARPKQEVALRLAAFRHEEPVELSVQQIRLVRFDARRIDSALETIATWPLR